jgi:uncharacterized membrane protein YdjX (TVP38/TMEM64 family)
VSRSSSPWTPLVILLVLAFAVVPGVVAVLLAGVLGGLIAFVAAAAVGTGVVLVAAAWWPRHHDTRPTR